MLLDNPNELKLIPHPKLIPPDAKPDYSACRVFRGAAGCSNLAL